MSEIDVMCALRFMGIKIKKPQGNEVICLCPQHDCGDESGHLFFNISKGMGFCHKCGWHGDVIQLYMDLYGCSFKTAKESLQKSQGVLDTNWYQKPKMIQDRPIADIKIRDENLSSLLLQLPLRKRHVEDLKRRGFTTLPPLYRSTPTKEELSTLHLGNATGVAGFYTLNGKTVLSLPKPGIFVPYVDIHNRIQGVQIRVDEESRKVDKKTGKKNPKYVWFSSDWVNQKKYKGEKGTAGRGFVHFAVDFCYPGEYEPILNYTVNGQNTVCITEGAMKADLFHAISGKPCIAIAGVRATKYLDETLEELRNHGVTQIENDFDMDYITNNKVQMASDKLEEMIRGKGFAYYRNTWNPIYKGIDDYYAHLAKELAEEICE